MRIAGETIGPCGAALLAVTAVAGIALGVHGWSGRNDGLASPPPAAARLSAQPYAGYAYLVWPGTPGAAARAAQAGLSIGVRRQGAGIWVAAGAAGQPAAGEYYPGGARVYVVGAPPAGESGRARHDPGGDRVVVTDAQGRIVR